MIKEEIKKLIEKYLDGSISSDEMHQLNKWYDLFDLKADLHTAGTDESNQAVSVAFTELKSKLKIS